MASNSYTQDLLDKIRALPDDKIAEVVDFVGLPEPHARKLSTAEAPPIHVGGKPASEIVLEDRR